MLRPHFTESVTAAAAALLVVAALVGVAVKDDDPTTSAAIANATAAPPVSSLAPLDPGATPGASAPVGSGALAGGATSGPQQTTAAGPVVGGRPSGPARGTPVKVGVHVGDNRSAASSFGLAGFPTITTQEIDSIIKDANRTGGLAGRPIAPVYHQTDPLDGSFDAQNQEACSAFTEDTKVSLVVANVLSPSRVLMNCLANKRVPLLWELHVMQITNAEAARLRGLLYRPSMPNAERLGVIVNGLADAGFFKNAKVGLLRYDTADAKLVSEKAFRPRLKARGVKVVAEYKMSGATRSTDATKLSGESSNAVLEFREKGVTHVLFVPSGGVIPLVFLAAAASQGFFPRYGISSQDAPRFLTENFDENQLGTSMAVGWSPLLDGDTPKPVPAVDRCRKAMTSTGLPWDEDIKPFCDAFFFLQHALARSSGVSIDSLRSGAEAVGTSFQSPYVFGTRFTPGHTDGPNQARVLKYDRSLDHFVYTGPMVGF